MFNAYSVRPLDLKMRELDMNLKFTCYRFWFIWKTQTTLNTETSKYNLKNPPSVVLQAPYIKSMEPIEDTADQLSA